MTGAGDNVTEDAARRPAPFTQSQVEALSRGSLSEEAVSAMFEAFPHPEGKRVRSTQQAPISVHEDELRRLTEGVTPAEVKKRLQAAAEKAPPLAKERREPGERPTKKPPQPRRAASSS